MLSIVLQPLSVIGMTVADLYQAFCQEREHRLAKGEPHIVDIAFREYGLGREGIPGVSDTDGDASVSEDPQD